MVFIRKLGNLFLLLAWSLFPWPASAQYTGRLIIEALTSTGDPIDEFQAILSTKDVEERREAVGSKLVFDGLHAERYAVQVRSKGYLRSERFVTVVPGETWLPVVLVPDGPICLPGPHRLLGRVLTAGNANQLWTKLVNVFEDTCLHARPDAGGEFVLSGMPPGRYFLFVYSKKKVLDVRMITIPRIDVLLISLSP